MTLSELVLQSKNWSKEKQKQFCNRLSYNMIICIRSIILDERLNADEKIQAIKYVNEFHHRVDNIKLGIDREEDNSILKIAKEATHYAKLNQTTANEIAAILNSTYNSMK